MNSLNELLTTEFAALKQELIAQSAGSVVAFELDGNRATLTAPAYLSGRKPGRQPPSEVIEQWIIDKGIAARLEKDMSVSGLAFLIARKIGREGWKPDKDKESDSPENLITPARIQQILDKVSAYSTENFCSEIINFLKTTV